MTQIYIVHVMLLAAACIYANGSETTVNLPSSSSTERDDSMKETVWTTNTTGISAMDLCDLCAGAAVVSLSKAWKSTPVPASSSGCHQPPFPFASPAQRRPDYTYEEGIGAHKLYTVKVPWNIARRTCQSDGGHLAIINSVAEAQAIVELIANRTTDKECIALGFHDQFNEGEYVTIHDQSLTQAGYEQWALDPASTERNCGCIKKRGLFSVGTCTFLFPFLCELPM